MECKKCKTKLDGTFNFCPNCGWKVSRRVDKLVLRNTDWLRLAQEEEVKSFFNSLVKMPVDDFLAWRQEMHENVHVFQIKATYYWMSNSDREWNKGNISGLSVKETIEEINNKYNSGYRCVFGEIETKEIKLSNACQIKDRGKRWFYTIEECNEAVSEVKEAVKFENEKMPIDWTKHPKQEPKTLVFNKQTYNGNEWCIPS